MTFVLLGAGRGSAQVPLAGDGPAAGAGGACQELSPLDGVPAAANGGGRGTSHVDEDPPP
jgi:hypothetical protein